jgi:hypothetical protein
MKGWSWVLAVVAGAAVLAAVAFGAYHAGEHHTGGHGNNDAVRVVSPVDGTSSSGVQVIHVDGGRHWGGHWGFFPGFFFLPLLFVFLLFVVFRAGRWGRWRGGWGGPWDGHSFD